MRFFHPAGPLRLILLALSGCLGSCKAPAPEPVRPNIIYILADDLGYGELGAYGQSLIETPNLDALAAGGMTFTQHYAGAPVCAPSRYMLLTGKHSGHAFIRGNDEWAARGPVWDYRAMAADSTLEGQRPLPPSEKLLPQWLQEEGYRTGMFGKWGLGAPQTVSVPNLKGFDEFYGYNCQRQAHTYYPLHLYHNRHRVALANDTVAPHTGFEALDGMEDFGYFQQDDYAPDRIFAALTHFVASGSDQPFFLYWATPIPHAPLQAPERWVNYYREKFGEEPPYDASEGGYFPQEYPRATYAAMISYLDENIGKLVALLQEKGLAENTLILFSSDNGPSYAGGAQPEWFGSANPFPSAYGRGKGFVYEGGIRVPLLAHWPGQIAPGSQSDHISAQYDLLPTLAELVGFATPEGVDGISFLPTLLGHKGQQQHPALVWAFPEYRGQLAVRAGPWKLVERGLNDSLLNPGPELYHLERDPQEQENLASRYPALVDSLATVFQKAYQVPETPRFRLREWEAVNAIPDL
ncbi:arylsulfatase [Robiginitalea sp. M366]|uniref:arylsulfatase n=1 Tax=Robiginitalea aestuariiviva TaxID=3036903 RepID=UPI00240D5EF1|nr:arylsulfatase [Robiginitalea aestuariiviva]MDG1573386.1 arylsulfatase [Robiginitalea aestuariiviva]